jgi:hypothetical protein
MIYISTSMTALGYYYDPEVRPGLRFDHHVFPSFLEMDRDQAAPGLFGPVPIS